MRTSARLIAGTAALATALLVAVPTTASAAPPAPAAAVSYAVAQPASAANSVISVARPQTAPVNVGTKQIDDQAGVGADTSAARDAIAALRSKAHINLYVVLVNSFDGVDKNAWAQQAFTASDLGDNDVLLAIAVQDHRFGGWVGVSVPLSNEQVGSVVNADAAPHMSTGDWSGAIVAAAQGLQAAATGSGASGNAGSSGAVTGTSSGHGSLAWLWLVLILAVVVIVALVLNASKRKRAAAATAKKNASPPPESYEKLSERSVNALIQTDNAVQASESELSLAEAEFGEQATAEFRTAHNDAKEKLTKAFQLRQEIDDEIPESEDTRRSWMKQILDLCQQASDTLEAQTEKFSELRDLGTRLPELLAALPGTIDATGGSAPAGGGGDAAARGRVLRAGPGHRGRQYRSGRRAAALRAQFAHRGDPGGYRGRQGPGHPRHARRPGGGRPGDHAARRDRSARHRPGRGGRPGRDGPGPGHGGALGGTRRARPRERRRRDGRPCRAASTRYRTRSSSR
jgi:uncharacterized membrane protein YgcG